VRKHQLSLRIRKHAPSVRLGPVSFGSNDAIALVFERTRPAYMQMCCWAPGRRQESRSCFEPCFRRCKAPEHVFRAASTPASQQPALRGRALLSDTRPNAVIIMIEIVCNDRLGKKIRVKCNEDDTIGDLKKLIAAQIGTRPEKIRLQKWYTVFKDHITLADYEIHSGSNLELYYT